MLAIRCHAQTQRRRNPVSHSRMQVCHRSFVSTRSLASGTVYQYLSWLCQPVFLYGVSRYRSGLVSIWWECFIVLCPIMLVVTCHKQQVTKELLCQSRRSAFIPRGAVNHQKFCTSSSWVESSFVSLEPTISNVGGNICLHFPLDRLHISRWRSRHLSRFGYHMAVWQSRLWPNPRITWW